MRARPISTCPIPEESDQARSRPYGYNRNVDSASALQVAR
jgi:hypothetical protein